MNRSDRNLLYDARVAGGFPYPKPPAPCAAADECHGEASAAQSPAQLGSGPELGALGNYPGPKKLRRHKPRHSRGHAGHHHRNKKGRNRR